MGRTGDGLGKAEGSVETFRDESREMFDVVVGASEMRSMENGVGGGWRVLWLDKRGVQESE